MNVRAKRLKRAWVVRWLDANKDESTVAAHSIYVLSARIGSVRVIEFMRALFINCPIFPLNERFRFMKRGFDWRSITKNSGSNIFIGDDGPWICAWYVADFEADWNEAAKSHTFRWTQQPCFRFERANEKIETMGISSRIEIRVTGLPTSF